MPLGDYEYEDLTQAGAELQAYMQDQAAQGNSVIDSADLATLARFGIDIAKTYVMANGQQVRYVPMQTATGTIYQRQVAGGLLSNPMMIAGIGLAALLLLKGH